MRIPCPYCGERGNGEFTILGDASKQRPTLGADAEALFDYVYLRPNPRGLVKEFWYHGAGCHAWLIVTRNTFTHEILNVEAARDAQHVRDADETA